MWRVEQSEIEYDQMPLGHSFFVTLDDRVSAIRESALIERMSTHSCRPTRSLAHSLTPRAHILVRDLDFGGWVSPPLPKAELDHIFLDNHSIGLALPWRVSQTSTRMTNYACDPPKYDT